MQTRAIARNRASTMKEIFRVLALPHYLVLCVLSVVACLRVIIAWFAILFTGRYPRSLFDFVVGVFRWWLRVAAYPFPLTTDHYQPFRLAA